MKRETVRHIREMAYFASIGMSVALSVVIGLVIGVVLDRYLGTQPWLTLIVLGLGIAAGFRNLLHAMERARKI
ncbi:MAG: AtpZ/AtpI family protein [Desulfatibacillaceae bacterium]